MCKVTPPLPTILGAVGRHVGHCWGATHFENGNGMLMSFGIYSRTLSPWIAPIDILFMPSALYLIGVYKVQSWKFSYGTLNLCYLLREDGTRWHHHFVVRRWYHCFRVTFYKSRGVYVAWTTNRELWRGVAQTTTLLLPSSPCASSFYFKFLSPIHIGSLRTRYCGLTAYRWNLCTSHPPSQWKRTYAVQLWVFLGCYWGRPNPFIIYFILVFACFYSIFDQDIDMGSMCMVVELCTTTPCPML